MSNFDILYCEKFEFGEGDPGFEVKRGVVSAVYVGTQADDLGVDAGWSVCKVNDQYLNPKEIDQVVTSGNPFSITFQTQDVKEREWCFHRSRITYKVM